MGHGQALEPFLRWAGGKRWLVEYLKKLFPANFRRYHEPFLGGGAVFFSLRPSLASLSDSNEWLITTYTAIRDNYDGVASLLAGHHHKHSTEYYYRIRARQFRTPVERAAQLIYLNRTCWNALFRVNKHGAFNVPKGTKEIVLYPQDDFASWREALSTADLSVADFREAFELVEEDDLVFADPPYITTHSMNGFVKYNEKIFTWRDQQDLFENAIAATRRGATVIVTNAPHSSIRQLYRGSGIIKKYVRRPSVIAASALNRRDITEAIILMRPE